VKCVDQRLEIRDQRSERRALSIEHRGLELMVPLPGEPVPLQREVRGGYIGRQ
jgi:hypothetical protein